MPSSNSVVSNPVSSELEAIDIMRAIDTPAQRAAGKKYSGEELDNPNVLETAIEMEAYLVAYMIMRRKEQLAGERLKDPAEIKIFTDNLRRAYTEAVIAGGDNEANRLIAEVVKNAHAYIDTVLPLPVTVRVH